MSARHQSRSITPEELQALQQDLDKSLGKDGSEGVWPEQPGPIHSSAVLVMPDGSTVETIAGSNMPVETSQRTAALNKATSRPAQGSAKAYESFNQMLSDMKDPRYGTNAAFTHEVEAKAAISNF
ncbi:MAG: hypothetical protein N0E59_19550 [Candidatus Thiodiazotropha taylori]|nr:hypothetical protein [Candidatus Thiodiazotropha taylori]MCG8097348.1 hypothetical protein [Candidatus Thiodiazotropha endolucinida]MCG8108861.1 hypothetical protein [Candidatus Thiodiazotropha taylori]MCG8112953.1 hypothetical protein [Candidatus Thiodiazotropha taylori]MCW4281197.1 hypothetical protein [Candidatus Thiodiazotropha taylori]